VWADTTPATVCERAPAALFADQSEAFERIDWKWLAEVLRRWALPDWLRHAALALVTNRAVVWLEAGKVGRARALRRGIGMGGPASPLLWGSVTTQSFGRPARPRAGPAPHTWMTSRPSSSARPNSAVGSSYCLPLAAPPVSTLKFTAAGGSSFALPAPTQPQLCGISSAWSAQTRAWPSRASLPKSRYGLRGRWTLVALRRILPSRNASVPSSHAWSRAALTTPGSMPWPTLPSGPKV